MLSVFTPWRGLLLVLLTVAWSLGQAAPERGIITGGKPIVYPSWFKESFLDIADDVDEASESGKHVILLMDMNGCPYCYKMVEENFKHAPYKEFIQANFDVIGLNVKGDREVALNAETTLTEKEIADKLGVRFTPGLVFLNADNNPVVKVNGYRNVRDFRVILDYVQNRTYEQQPLAAYIREHKENEAYTLRDHPQFQALEDLSALPDKPIALFFEDSGCLDCAALHDGHLAAKEVRDVLANYTVVRIDAFSDNPITDFEGKPTTERAFAEAQGVSYTPAIVLRDRGKELLRLESMLYRYHFTGL
ncbi:MAG TPA: thioredoxin, partial [Gammaproteobacteria bacterium]|nr:thioredoxin [Gammaproteobacteria bacterium]